jgi:Tfp pilus assembly protein PilP
MAQTPQPGAPAPAAPAATPATPATAPAQGAAAAGEKKADALEPQGFTYNPERRRDPFVSLLRRGAESATGGSRVAGLSGLGTAEVSLRGTVMSQGAFVGIIRGVDSKTYIVRAGDKLSDGSIRSITADAMVILQQVNDPLSLEKEREVRKLLRQTEEGK